MYLIHTQTVSGMIFHKRVLLSQGKVLSWASEGQELILNYS